MMVHSPRRCATSTGTRSDCGRRRQPQRPRATPMPQPRRCRVRGSARTQGLLRAAGRPRMPPWTPAASPKDGSPDALVAAMEAHGLSGTIVNLGGNVAVSGTKPSGDPWRVGIRDPRDPSQLIAPCPWLRGRLSRVASTSAVSPHPTAPSTTTSSIRARDAPSKPTWPASPSSARNPSTRRASLPPCSPSASNADSPSPVDTPKFCRPFSSPPTALSPTPAERAMKSLYRGEIVASSNRRRTLD